LQAELPEADVLVATVKSDWLAGPTSPAPSYLKLVARLSEQFATAKASPLLQAYLHHLARCMDAWVRALAAST
jgi:hypothetical protein